VIRIRTQAEFNERTDRPTGGLLKKLPQDPVQQIVTILVLLIVLVIVSHLDLGALPGEYPGGPIHPQP